MSQKEHSVTFTETCLKQQQIDVCCLIKSSILSVSCRGDSCVVNAVCELRSPSMSDFLEGLESSGWLKHIKAVLDAGIFIAKVRL